MRLAERWREAGRDPAQMRWNLVAPWSSDGLLGALATWLSGGQVCVAPSSDAPTPEWEICDANREHSGPPFSTALVIRMASGASEVEIAWEEETLVWYVDDLRDAICLEEPSCIWCDPFLDPACVVLVLVAWLGGHSVCVGSSPSPDSDILFVHATTAQESSFPRDLARMYCEGGIDPTDEKEPPLLLGFSCTTGWAITHVERPQAAARRAESVGRPVVGFSSKIDKAKRESGGRLWVRLPQEYRVFQRTARTPALRIVDWVDTGREAQIRSGFLEYIRGHEGN